MSTSVELVSIDEKLYKAIKPVYEIISSQLLPSFLEPNAIPFKFARLLDASENEIIS